MSAETLRKSTLATLSEIVPGEKRFLEEQGIDIRDEDEWQSLGQIVRRIEEKLALKMPRRDKDKSE